MTEGPVAANLPTLDMLNFIFNFFLEYAPLFCHRKSYPADYEVNICRVLKQIQLFSPLTNA